VGIHRLEPFFVFTDSEATARRKQVRLGVESKRTFSTMPKPSRRSESESGFFASKQNGRRARKAAQRRGESGLQFAALK
jgi:hypothetical protein